MSEAKAQARAIRDKKLQDLGSQYDKIDPNEFPVFEQMMMEYGLLFNESVQKFLKQSGSIASGKIGDLVVPKLKKFGNDYEMTLGYDTKNPASKYYDFINKGVRGVGGEFAKPKKVSSDSPYAYKTPYPNKEMATSILKWYKLGKAKTTNETQTKKLSKTQRKNKKLKQIVNKTDSLKTLAYATAAAIKRDGLKSTLYFDKAIKEVFDKEFFETMAETFGGDLTLHFQQISNKIEKDGNNSK
jgi:hypothetical protein